MPANDYSTYVCPYCREVGQAFYDTIINKYKCGACGAMGFDPNVQTKPLAPSPIVIDYLIDPSSKVRSMIEVVCPKENPPPLLFDPRSPEARAIKKRLRPLVAKEKRYRRDRLNAHGQQPVNVLDEVKELLNKEK